MNKQILKAVLFYPRYHIRNNLLQRDCPFNNRFQAEQMACGECLYQDECRWLGDLESEPNLDNRTAGELLRTLAFAIHYIDADVAYWGHDSRRCACEACRWLRDAQQELQQAAGIYH